METFCSLPIDDEKLQDLISHARDFARSHSVAMRKSRGFGAETHLVTFNLLPSPVPHQVFHDAKSLQTDFNLLIRRVAHDHEFLEKSLHSTILVDEFTKQLWDVYLKCREDINSQKIGLGIFRCDYMFTNVHASDASNGTCNINERNKDKWRLNLVEINSVSARHIGLSSQMSKLHSYVLELMGCNEEQSRLPQNNSRELCADGIIKAWEVYNSSRAVVLFVVREEAKARNIFDQRMIECSIKEKNKKINVMRRNFKEISDKSQLMENNKLFIDGMEVAVVYFRVGYSPDCYPTQKEWDARLLLERSSAIKCPPIQYQLAASKRVQASLASPGAVEMFLPPDSAARIRNTLVPQYKLEMDGESTNLLEQAANKPENYVLKPQRDGGGNLFGRNITNALENNPEMRTSYVLMERIRPPKFENYLVSEDGEPQVWEMDNELGIYGVILGDDDNVIMNKQCGHMLKSKPCDRDEGGVGKPLGALDSPYLV